MAKNIHGGGSKTNANGLKFEQETQLQTALTNIGLRILNVTDVYCNNKKIGLLLSKNNLYTYFLNKSEISWKCIISKKLIPDDALFLFNTHTLYIIEKKFQTCSGSVDEKLQTCDFKKKQYIKLVKNLDSTFNVEYIYVLNDWFKKPSYDDVLKYIKSVSCHYFFNEIPLEFLNLPN